MALSIPIEGGGDPGGGGPGSPTPTDPGTALAFTVTSTSITIAADQIAAAGGPWAAFTVRVTPMNANGVGTSADVAYP